MCGEKGHKITREDPRLGFVCEITNGYSVTELEHEQNLLETD